MGIQQTGLPQTVYQPTLCQFLFLLLNHPPFQFLELLAAKTFNVKGLATKITQVQLLSIKLEEDNYRWRGMLDLGTF